VHIWLDHATVAKLNHLARPGQSRRDVIIRVARARRVPPAEPSVRVRLPNRKGRPKAAFNCLVFSPLRRGAGLERLATAEEADPGEAHQRLCHGNGSASRLAG
jgi:hypothetical protein